ncbi:unnamed protein product [Nippostrongylus brasiliensis]|uniref:Transposase n=1 Tax=Nippostrongylus brasiliensis TaxID=27835 RepID=A0A0N4YE91_NIPBR|nr:unnamed protein product [Nippostrongylus brasiliensis]
MEKPGQPAAPKKDNDDYYEIERKRSIVISGISELVSKNSGEKAWYDYLSVRNVLDHIGAQCLPLSVYRLCRPTLGRNRLLKAVFPCSYFQKFALNFANCLRSFPEKAAFIEEYLSSSDRFVVSLAGGQRTIHS